MAATLTGGARCTFCLLMLAGLGVSGRPVRPTDPGGRRTVVLLLGDGEGDRNEGGDAQDDLHLDGGGEILGRNRLGGLGDWWDKKER